MRVCKVCWGPFPLQAALWGCSTPFRTGVRSSFGPGPAPDPRGGVHGGLGLGSRSRPAGPHLARPCNGRSSSSEQAKPASGAARRLQRPRRPSGPIRAGGAARGRPPAREGDGASGGPAGARPLCAGRRRDGARGRAPRSSRRAERTKPGPRRRRERRGPAPGPAPAPPLPRAPLPLATGRRGAGARRPRGGGAAPYWPARLSVAGAGVACGGRPALARPARAVTDRRSGPPVTRGRRCCGRGGRLRRRRRAARGPNE